MRLRLMPDYDCHPLWLVLPDGVKNLDPATLPISTDLRQTLKDWAASYDKTLNEGDPANSGFPSEAEESQFESTGIRLWDLLRSELGPGFEVTYFSQKAHRELGR